MEGLKHTLFICKIANTLTFLRRSRWVYSCGRHFVPMICGVHIQRCRNCYCSVQRLNSKTFFTIHELSILCKDFPANTWVLFCLQNVRGDTDFLKKIPTKPKLFWIPFSQKCPNKKQLPSWLTSVINTRLFQRRQLFSSVWISSRWCFKDRTGVSD